jgi:hypothetical protein
LKETLFRRWIQEDCEVKARLDYVADSTLKNKDNNRERETERERERERQRDKERERLLQIL